MITESSRRDFIEIVWAYYRENGRHELPWRQPEATRDAYAILVSEIMLQQTQVARVVPKYEAFLALFPTLEALAAANQGEVIRAWSGLGYNRRAKYLQASAQVAVHRDGGLPQSVDELQTLPGVGPNTAGAIAVYAYNQAVVFVETNIRTVYIHHFLHNQTNITDQAISLLVADTLDSEHPREWYWALMDYGSYLKQTVGNLGLRSKHYTKQSSFEGSKRQLRGKVLRLLIAGPHSTSALTSTLEDDRLQAVLDDLVAEGLIKQINDTYQL